jgi:Protein of unknown function (DUF2975)
MYYIKNLNYKQEISVSIPRTPFAALLTRFMALALGLSLFFANLGAPELLHLQGSNVMMTPVYWISLLAPAFFLWALWAASEAIVRMDRGEAFGPAVVRGLKEIGGCLMLGSFAAAVVQPSLIYLIGNGFTEMRGVRMDLDVENVTLALIGLVLTLLARQGQKLQSKLDQFV